MHKISSSMNPNESTLSTSMNIINNYHKNDKLSDTHHSDDSSIGDKSIDDRSIDDRSIDGRSIDDRSIGDKSINDNKSIGDYSINSKNDDTNDNSRSLFSGSIADTTLTTVDGRHSQSKHNLSKPFKLFEIDYVGTGTYQVSQQNILQKRSIEPYKNSEALLSSRGSRSSVYIYIYIYIFIRNDYNSKQI